MRPNKTAACSSGQLAPPLALRPEHAPFRSRRRALLQAWACLDEWACLDDACLLEGMPFLKNGQVVNKFVGMQPKDAFSAALDEALA